MLYSVGTVPLTPNFGTTWRRTVSFCPSRYNPKVRGRGGHLDRQLNKLQGPFGSFGKETNLVHLRGIETKFLQCSSRRLYYLQYSAIFKKYTVLQQKFCLQKSKSRQGWNKWLASGKSLFSTVNSQELSGGTWFEPQMEYQLHWLRLCGRTAVTMTNTLLWTHSKIHRLSKTSLDEESVRRRDLYWAIHNIHKIQLSIAPGGFEPTISVSECPQTYALDRVAIVIRFIF